MITNDTTTQHRAEMQAAARRAQGLRILTARAQRIIGRVDWADHWPEIDADRRLTGEIVEASDIGDGGRYAMFCDEGAIDADDARLAGWRVRHGDATPPPTRAERRAAIRALPAILVHNDDERLGDDVGPFPLADIARACDVAGIWWLWDDQCGVLRSLVTDRVLARRV
jgi:hypothetical protein